MAVKGWQCTLRPNRVNDLPGEAMNQAIDSEVAVNLTTQQALESQPLAPRFYCTDYAAMEHIDVEPVRAEWDLMMRDFEMDKNRAISSKTMNMTPIFWSPIPN